MTLTESPTPAPSPGSTTPTVTVATLARDWAVTAPHQIAMREKDYGIWHEYDWATTWDLIETVGHALLALGVEPGDRVSIHSEDRPNGSSSTSPPWPCAASLSASPHQSGRRGRVLLTDCGAGPLREDQGSTTSCARSAGRTCRNIRTIGSPNRAAWWHRRRPACCSGKPARALGVSIAGSTHRGGRPDGRRPTRRRDDTRLHVGTTGPPKGRCSPTATRFLSSTRSSAPPTFARGAPGPTT